MTTGKTELDEEELDKASTFEDILEIVGTNGRRNYTIFFSASFISMITAIPAFSYQFLGATPSHWCHVHDLVSSNWTEDQIKEIAIPYTESNGKRSYSECEMFDLNYIELSRKTFKDVVKELELNDNLRNKTVRCSSRDFEEHVETIVNKWDLVCERRALYSTTQAATQIGTLVGALVGGYLIDRFGRNFSFKICLILYLISGLIIAASPSITFFIVFRLLASSVGTVLYVASFVLCMELASAKQRSWVGSYYPLPWAFGIMLTSFIAYFVRPWYLLQIAITAPALCLLVNFWILPESPRWLIIKGRHQEALTFLTALAKSNEMKLPPERFLLEIMKKIEKENVNSENQAEKTSLNELVKTFLKKIFVFVLNPKLRLRTVGLFICWFTVAMVYYGVSLASVTLSTNDYLYIFLSGITEIPSYLLLWPALVFLGRRRTLVLFFFICAASILAVMAMVITDINDDFAGLKLFLFLIGKFAITAAFQLIYIYTAELYPTELRSLIIGECSAVARTGSISSPYINDILGKINSWSPAAVFGILSFLAGVVTFSFPETSEKKLADSVDKLDELKSIKETK